MSSQSHTTRGLPGAGIVILSLQIGDSLVEKSDRLRKIDAMKSAVKEE
jgi:hypothetical protein